MLPRIVEAVLGLEGGWRVLVVDDSSPDGTGELANELAAGEERLSVLHRPRKEGLGPAYLAAFREALARPGVEFIAQVDADFSHNPADLPRLLEATADAGLAIGSRYTAGGRTEGWGLRRRLLSRWGNAYVRAVLGSPVHDLTAGFRMWRRSALEAIDIDAVAARGYGFQIEMACRALAAGHRVVEVPICFTERRAGKSKMSGSIVAEALVLPWKLRRLQ
ncbi:MAG: polyprenol monophosphomannose synthase [Armatimonadota bacterium]|nr:MAG: polyprenol monophosphomannose synthase [Armatimonadota bacterium]